MKSLSKIPTRLGAALLILSPLWFFIAVPALERIPEAFHYRAEVLSLDNPYDSTQKKFIGEQRSVSNFSYDVVKKINNTLLIQNTFIVREITGKEIFSVKRLYGIDAKTGRHVKGYGDENRIGHLFAPRRLQPSTPVTYWHVNYDVPAKLSYQGEENIAGLKVYHYTTNFAGQRIDQTANLTNLPGVPHERGIEVEARLDAWFEPVTGRLIKYKDNAIGYFYDQATRERIEPWNAFSNTFTPASIREQAAIAAREKTFAIVIERVIPLLLALGGISMLIYSSFSRQAGLVAFVGGIGAITIYLIGVCLVPRPANPLLIGIARWDATPSIDRNIEGFKKAFAEGGYIENKDVVFIEPSAAERSPTTFKKIIGSFLDRKVDLIYSLTTPGTIIAKEMTTSTPIVFSVVTYPVETGLIASLLKSGNNLVGTRNWVPAEDQLDNFLIFALKTRSISFVRRNGEPNSMIQLDEFKKAASGHGITTVDLPVETPSDIAEELARRPATDALYLSCDTLAQSAEGERVAISFAEKAAIPLFTCNETGVRNGGLMGTVADFYRIGKLSGEKAVLILSGATPNSLETESVLRPSLFINRDNAAKLNLVIPQELELEADIISTK